MAIAEGSVLNPLSAVAGGARVTWFLPDTDPQAARKRWIAAMKPKGEITVDAGAAQALGQGKSLLPAGVTAVTGRFGRGDPVVVLDGRGARLADADGGAGLVAAGRRGGRGGLPARPRGRGAADLSALRVVDLIRPVAQDPGQHPPHLIAQRPLGVRGIVVALHQPLPR